MPNKKLNALIESKGIAALAREMSVAVNTVRAWRDRGYVPASRLVDFCNALDIDLDLNLSIRPDNARQSAKTVVKPPETLATLVEVQRGNLSIEEASEQLGVSETALTVAYAQNEHRLFLLYSTLTAFSEGCIDATQAAKALDVTKTQVYYLMRTYGVPKPKRESKPKKVGRTTKIKPSYEKLALDVIAGRTNAKRAAEDHPEIALRSLHRYVKRYLQDLSLTELAHWPKSFRIALAQELEQGSPKLVEKWVEFANKHGLVLEKRVRRLPEVKNWREVDAKRMLVAVLQGEATLQEIAQLRRGSEIALRDMFNGVLKSLGVRYAEVAGLPVVHQMALGDLLIMLGSHYRRSV